MKQQIPVLPFELLRPILAHIAHNPSLCAASLSSKALQAEAQCILFRDPCIQVPDQSTAYRHLRLLESIIESPTRLAKLVIRYTQSSIWTGSSSYHRGSEDEQNAAIEEKTPIALRLMVNLKHLTYRQSGGTPSAHMLQGCQFKLKTLDWGCHSDEVAMFRDVLPTQPHLVYLSLDEVDTAVLKEDPTLWESIKGLLPQLVSLMGSRETLEAILPGRLGRPIECIHWIPNDFDSREASVDHMSRELGHVRYMFIGGYFARPDLSLLISHLCSLELLDVVNCRQEVRHQSISHLFKQVKFNKKELQLLGQLPKLRHLILTSWMDQTSREADACLSLATVAFNSCRHLQQIDVKHTRDHYIRYDCTASPFGSRVWKISAEDVGSWRNKTMLVRNT